jgi:hypothetical protein
MNQNSGTFQKIILSILVCIILIASGCTGNLKSNIPEQRTQFTEPSTVIPTLQQFPVSTLETQNKTVTTPTSGKVIVTPHFNGTISYSSNRSFALTEDQAWRYAEVFFEKHGIRDIQSSEVRPLGQFMWTFENKSQTMTWGFQVNRIQSKANIGGTITIDAYDGHVIDIGWFD